MGLAGPRKAIRRWASFLLLLNLLAGPAAAAPAEGEPPAAAPDGPAVPAPPGWGPFRIPALAPFQQFRLAYLHEGPWLAAEGTFTAAFAATWVNVWALDWPDYRFDGEVVRATPFLRYAPTPRLDLAVEWPVLYVVGGQSDAAIQHFHRALDLPNGFRQVYPQGEVRFERVGRDGRLHILLDDADAGFWKRAPVLSLRYGLLGASARLPLTAKASLSLPALERRSRMAPGKGNDWALGLSTAGRLAGALSATASVAYVRNRPDPQPDIKREQASGMFDLEYGFSPRMAGVIQVVSESGVTRRSETNLDKSASLMAIGMKWRLPDGVLFEAAFLQDAFFSGNTIDVGLHVAVTADFR
ncbi:MAG: DUF3187 family protein [Candidatus Lambdaproteobacteria bacterium]|nr:DUF3187 family protein [Candidatus Lambdaproteobacteria bacterium]